MCVYRCASFVQVANADIYVCVYTFVLFFYLLRDLFFTLSLYFQVNHPSLSLFFHSTAHSLPTLAQVRNVITFEDCSEGKEGIHVCEEEGSFEQNRGGRRRKRYLYVYPITTPASPKSPSTRTDAHSENSYLHPASCVCVCVCVLQW